MEPRGGGSTRWTLPLCPSHARKCSLPVAVPPTDPLQRLLHRLGAISLTVDTQGTVRPLVLFICCSRYLLVKCSSIGLANSPPPALDLRYSIARPLLQNVASTLSSSFVATDGDLRGLQPRLAEVRAEWGDGSCRMHHVVLTRLDRMLRSDSLMALSRVSWLGRWEDGKKLRGYGPAAVRVGEAWGGEQEQ